MYTKYFIIGLNVGLNLVHNFPGNKDLISRGNTCAYKGIKNLNVNSES